MGSTKKPKLSRREIDSAVQKAIRKDAKQRKQDEKFRKQMIAIQTEAALQDACDKGDTLCEMDRNKIFRQSTCNHRKGGMVERRLSLYGQDGETPLTWRTVFPTQGTDHQFAVVKHQHMNGDVWVFCLRCGKKWKPPIRANYVNETQFILACVDYQKALEFPTNNVMSSSVQVRFIKPTGSEKYRKLLSNS